MHENIDYVLDPFSGSGTVLLESQFAGFPAVGFEQNPIAAMISRVKTTPIDIDDLHDKYLHIITMAKKARAQPAAPDYLRKWYDSTAFATLSRIGKVLMSCPHQPSFDCIRLSYALLARRVSVMDRRIPVPVRDRALLERRYDTWQIWRELDAIFSATVERVSTLPHRLPDAMVCNVDARERRYWDDLASRGNGLIITSPPYGAAQKYIRSTSLEAGWLGFASNKGTIELERTSVGREHLSPADQLVRQSDIHDPKLRLELNKISSINPTRAMIYRNYFKDMQTVTNNIEQSRASITRVCLITGTNIVTSRTVNTAHYLNRMLASAGFTKTLAVKDTIRGRTLLTSRRGGSIPALAEFIDIFERGPRG